MSATAEPVRLTQLSHGGGCGCKIAPGVLDKILKEGGNGFMPLQLLVGRETCDDAAVYQISDTQAIVATTDFFMPVVDDPYDFGRIAATNAISDIYAMGGAPLFALAIVGMPVKQLPPETIGRILAGGESVCTAAGIPVAGGHTIDSVEPIYGLAVIGMVNPRYLKRNCDAKPGDKLILSKPLGIGVYSAALKQEKLTKADYAAFIEVTTQMNKPGAVLGCLPTVHAMTDVTGFGLLGHLWEMCKGSGVAARIDLARLPFLPSALALAESGMVTGASARNWESYGQRVSLPSGLAERHKALLTDPQTSGGLLIACAPEAVTEILSGLMQQGFCRAAVIGEIVDGSPNITVA